MLCKAQSANNDAHANRRHFADSLTQFCSLTHSQLLQNAFVPSAPLTTSFSFLMKKLICVQRISDEGHLAALVVCTVLREIVLANLKDADEAATSSTGREEVGRLHGGGRKDKKMLGLKTARANKVGCKQEKPQMARYTQTGTQTWSTLQVEKKAG